MIGTIRHRARAGPHPDRLFDAVSSRSAEPTRPRLPALETLLARARRTAGRADWRAWLAARYGGARWAASAPAQLVAAAWGVHSPAQAAAAAVLACHAGALLRRARQRAPASGRAAARSSAHEQQRLARISRTCSPIHPGRCSARGERELLLGGPAARCQRRGSGAFRSAAIPPPDCRAGRGRGDAAATGLGDRDVAARASAQSRARCAR